MGRMCVAGMSLLLLSAFTESWPAPAVKSDERQSALAEAEANGIDLIGYEDEVRLGTTNLDAYQSTLKRMKFDEKLQLSLIRALKAQIASDKTAQDSLAAAVSSAGRKGVALRDMELEVRSGVRPIQDYETALSNLGFKRDAIQPIISCLRVGIKHHRNLKKESESAAQLKKKDIELSELRKAVRLGLISIGRYQEVLAAAGISSIDRRGLATLALVDAEKSQLTESERFERDAIASLPSNAAEVAESGRVSDLAQFRLYLLANGYSAADAATLSEIAGPIVERSTKRRTGGAPEVDAAPRNDGTGTTTGSASTNDDPVQDQNGREPKGPEPAGPDPGGLTGTPGEGGPFQFPQSAATVPDVLPPGTQQLPWSTDLCMPSLSKTSADLSGQMSKTFSLAASEGSVLGTGRPSCANAATSNGSEPITSALTSILPIELPPPTPTLPGSQPPIFRPGQLSSGRALAPTNLSLRTF